LERGQTRPKSCSVRMIKVNARSIRGVVQVAVDVKSWMAKPPSVDKVRPACCPACEAPSHPVGANLVLYGHGLRQRKLWGPPAPRQAPAVVVFQGRRYECQRCGAVTMVVPAETLTRRRYSGPSIAWALALFGVALMSPLAIRYLVSPWKTWSSTWVTPLRWASDASEGRLFRCVRPLPKDWPTRKMAERVATTVAAYAPPSPEPPAVDILAFVGAALAR
jgi:hypothetical protein